MKEAVYKSAMAEAQGIPEIPKKAKSPQCCLEHASFTSLRSNLLHIIEALARFQQKELRDFIQTVIHPGVPKDKVPHTSSKPLKLMPYMEQYCNRLNKKLAKMIIEYLNDDELTKQLKEYERTLSNQLQHAGWDTDVDVAPPPAYTVMLVKMRQRSSTTVREAVEVQEFLEENVMFEGHHGILYLAGLSNHDLVFYLAEGAVGPVLQRILMNEKDTVLGHGIEQVTIENLATLTVAGGNIRTEELTEEPAAECPEFGVLMIGETGSGKSTLINNLLGTDVVPEGHTCYPETEEITLYRGVAAGVPVILYDTPGADGSVDASDEKLCRKIKNLFKSKKICLTIFCFSMNEQRLKRSHIATMQAYHKARVKWDKTIVALTFADKIKAPRTKRRSDHFREADYFKEKIQEWKGEIRDTLIQDVNVARPMAESLIMCPTTDELDTNLPDDQEWFIPLWLDILDLLEPAAYLRFLEIHRQNIGFDRIISMGHDGRRRFSLAGRHSTRFWEIARNRHFLDVLSILCCGSTQYSSSQAGAPDLERTPTDC